MRIPGIPAKFANFCSLRTEICLRIEPAPTPLVLASEHRSQEISQSGCQIATASISQIIRPNSENFMSRSLKYPQQLYFRGPAIFSPNLALTQLQVSRLPCYVFIICLLTTNKNPNENKLSWAIN